MDMRDGGWELGRVRSSATLQNGPEPPPTQGLFAVRVSRYASRARLSGPRRKRKEQAMRAAVAAPLSSASPLCYSMRTMSFSEKIAFAGWVVTTLGLLYAMHRNRVLDERAKDAEARLAQTRRRGEGPYLVPYPENVGHVYEQENENTFFWSVTNSNVLSVYRQKVEGVKDGDPVVLILYNQGGDARRISIETDLQDCVIRQEPDMSGAHGLIFLKYAYESAKAGKPCLLHLSFESPTGHQDTHTYQTIHGERAFTRIEPA